MSVVGGLVERGVVENGVAEHGVVIETAPRSIPRRMNAFLNWKFWLGIVISAVFLYLALRGQPLRQTWAAMTRAQYLWLIPAVIAFFVRVGFAAWRWHVLLRSTKEVPVSRIWPINMIGFMANNVLPLRAGEALRIYQLGAQEKLSRSGILATLFVERIFDGLTLLSLIVISTLFIPINDQVHKLTITTAFIFFGALAVFCLVAFSGAWRLRLLTPVLARLPGKLSESMSRRFDEFVAGLGSLRRGRDVSMVLVTSFASWLAELGTYLFVAQAFHLNLGIAGAMLTMGVANVFTLIPSSPGYVGPFEAGTLLVLQQILHFPNDLTLAYALVIHATLYFPVTIAGAFYWFRHHLSMNAVSQAQGNATTVAGD